MIIRASGEREERDYHPSSSSFRALLLIYICIYILTVHVRARVCVFFLLCVQQRDYY